jgi:hypothetical protein
MAARNPASKKKKKTKLNSVMKLCTHAYIRLFTREDHKF